MTEGDERADNDLVGVMFVHLDYGRDPKNFITNTNTNTANFPYGYGYCSESFDVRLSTSSAENSLARLARRALGYALGFDLVHAWRNRASMRAADVLITHTEHEYLAIALLKLFRLVPQIPLVGQTIWLWDAWPDLGFPRRLIYRRLLGEVNFHSTHSPLNAAYANSIVGEPVSVVPFGADLAPRSTSTASLGHQISAVDVVRVLAPGSDRHRDWDLIVSAALKDPRLEVTIVSRRWRARVAARKCPSRVRVIESADSGEVRRLMDSHDVVAIPLARNMHASGLTVFFEAFAASVPIVAVRTGGLELYAEDQIAWAAAGDVDDFIRGIFAACQRERSPDLNPLQFLQERGFTIQDYGLRHNYIALGLLQPAKLDAYRDLISAKVSLVNAP